MKFQMRCFIDTINKEHHGAAFQRANIEGAAIVEPPGEDAYKGVAWVPIPVEWEDKLSLGQCVLLTIDTDPEVIGQ